MTPSVSSKPNKVEKWMDRKSRLERGELSDGCRLGVGSNVNKSFVNLTQCEAEATLNTHRYPARSSTPLSPGFSLLIYIISYNCLLSLNPFPFVLQMVSDVTLHFLTTYS